MRRQTEGAPKDLVAVHCGLLTEGQMTDLRDTDCGPSCVELRGQFESDTMHLGFVLQQTSPLDKRSGRSFVIPFRFGSLPDKVLYRPRSQDISFYYDFCEFLPGNYG